MDNSQLSEQINKKYASLKRHEANVERLLNKEPFTEFDNKKLHREKYMVRKIRKAISDIEEHLKNKNMITEDYVSFEIAKLLKEKGFDEVTSKWYLKYKGEYSLVSRGSAEHTDDSIDVPTLQMAMRWLREVHHLFIGVEPRLSFTDYYWITANVYRVRKKNSLYHAEPVDDYSCVACCDGDSFEDACEKAIKYCLENLI